MTEADMDALTAKVFATPQGAQWLALFDGRLLPNPAQIRDSILRMRERWETGGASWQT